MEYNVLQAKTALSDLLRRVEAGESVVIRRGKKGPRFRIVADVRPLRRSLDPEPRWKGKIAYDDAAIWESEWRDDG